jgi:hypothetical protein
MEALTWVAVGLAVSGALPAERVARSAARSQILKFGLTIYGSVIGGKNYANL